jgi:hypothetical protein
MGWEDPAARRYPSIDGTGLSAPATELRRQWMRLRQPHDFSESPGRLSPKAMPGLMGISTTRRNGRILRRGASRIGSGDFCSICRWNEL